MAESVYQVIVKELMTGHPVTLDAAATVHEALNIMSENRVSSLPVVDNDNQCVGILSTADLVEMARDVDDDLENFDDADLGAQRDLLDKLSHAVGHESIQTYMTEVVDTVSQDATLADAARAMVKQGIHHLPVVDSKKSLVGILSTMDLLRAFAEHAPK